MENSKTKTTVGDDPRVIGEARALAEAWARGDMLEAARHFRRAEVVRELMENAAIRG